MKKIILLVSFFININLLATVESDYLSTVALQSDGKIVTAGNAIIDGVTQYGLFRFTNPGVLDTSFGGTGIVNTIIGSISEICAIKLQADGKIVAVGFATIAGVSNIALARYNVDGSLDTTFGPSLNGIITGSVGDGAVVRSLAIDASNKIVLAGITIQSGVSKFLLIRLNTDGSLDSTFGSGGIVITAIGVQAPSANSIAIQSDNKIVVGGVSSDGINGEQFTLARYNTDGTLDNSFDSDGTVVTIIDGSSYIRSIIIQPDGKIVAGGYTVSTTSDTDFAMARYNTDGSLDTGFATSGIFTATISSRDEIHSVVLQSDGKIVAGGISDLLFVLARFNTDGTLDTTFGIAGLVTNQLHLKAGINDIVIQPDGSIVAAGFDDNRAVLERFTTLGILDTTFGNNGVINSPAPPVTLDGFIIFNSYSFTKDVAASPDTKFDDVYTTSGVLFPMRVWSMHPSGSTQEAITLLFNIPQDFDTLLPLELELHLLVDNKGATGTTAAIQIYADFKSAGMEIGASAGGPEQSITSSTLTFTEPTSNDLRHESITIPLNNSDIFPGDIAFIAFVRTAPTGTEYNNDIYLSSVSFKYKKALIS